MGKPGWIKSDVVIPKATSTTRAHEALGSGITRSHIRLSVSSKVPQTVDRSMSATVATHTSPWSDPLLTCSSKIHYVRLPIAFTFCKRLNDYWKLLTCWLNVLNIGRGKHESYKLQNSIIEIEMFVYHNNIRLLRCKRYMRQQIRPKMLHYWNNVTGIFLPYCKFPASFGHHFVRLHIVFWLHYFCAGIKGCCSTIVTLTI